MKYSVVVAVYNIEKYIQECVVSILNQTCPDFELILVDDGSTDRSGQICDDLSSNDLRIRVIHQSNGGLSDARNTGLKQAQGEYVYFIDGDDYIHADTLQSFEKYIQIGFPEVILGRMNWFIDGEENFTADSLDISNDLLNDLDGQSAYVKIMKTFGTIRLGVRGAYKRQFLIDHNLLFKKGLYAEDMEWTIRVLQCAKSIASDHQANYFYRDKRPGSLVNTLSASKAATVFSILMGWVDIAQNPSNSSDFNRILLKDAGKRFFNTLRKYNRELNPAEHKRFLPMIKEWLELLNYNHSKPARLFKCAKNILGLTTTLRMMRFLENTAKTFKRSSRYDKIPK